MAHMESIYWAFTHRCNQYCGHCYNHSRPGGPTITTAEASAVIEHLPQSSRLTLSGGEPLVERELLLHILNAASSRFGNETRLALQTNGDLLDADVLDELLDAGVRSISIASQDAYHAKRDGLREHLRAEGIGTQLHYPVPIHFQKAYTFLGKASGSFPESESAASEVLSLPMYPELTSDAIDTVARAIKDYFS